jgi:hypothetical protein
VNVAVHRAVAPAAPDGWSVQVAPLNVPVLGAAVKATVLVGMSPPVVSVTVAVLVTGAPVPVLGAEHVRLVEVGAVAADAGDAAPRAPSCVASTSNAVRRRRANATYSGIRSW